MTTHSSIPAWRSPRTEEPDRLCFPSDCQDSDMTEATEHDILLVTILYFLPL